jgi:ABC-type transport system involved in cytochrome bd biosynthesis fused ATPase/permease subunit
MREYGHANQPHLVRDIQQKKILDVLESATRGLRRVEAVLDRVPEQQISALLAKLQAPPLNEIADMPKSRQQLKHRILRLLDLDFIPKGTNVCIIGYLGVGKTLLAGPFA